MFVIITRGKAAQTQLKPQRGKDSATREL